MKSWTYAEITANAEAKIKHIMDMAATNRESARLMRQWAYGVYDSWSCLTIGWQEDGDDERLKRLTEGD